MQPFDIQWLVPDRVLLIRFYGHFSSDNLEKLNDAMTHYLNEGDAPVHVITDNTRLEGFPTNINQLRQSLIVLRDERWGWMIAVGINAIVRFLLVVLSATFNLQAKALNTVDDGKKFLNGIEPGLFDEMNSAS
jgi:hypothetical protein